MPIEQEGVNKASESQKDLTQGRKVAKVAKQRKRSASGSLRLGVFA